MNVGEGSRHEGDRVAGMLSATAREASSSVIRDLLRHADRDDVISLAGGIPAAELFPLERLAGSLVAAFESEGAAAAQYGLTEGVTALRELIAVRAADHGAPAGIDQVLVTTGSQQALDLVGRVLVDPGDAVVVDDPGYLGALQALRPARPRLVGVPVDEGGMDTARLEELLVGGLRPKLVYTNPNFQNPSGATLTPERRRHLAGLADHYGFVVVEDDPYGNLRFEGREDDSMSVHSPLVVRVRTVSKVLAPGLRVAWAIGPARLIEAMGIAKQAVDLHTSTVTQYMALGLLTDESWDRAHRKSLAPWYRERRDALMGALDRHLGERFEFTPPAGGMFLWGRVAGLPDEIDTADLLPAAIEAGVAYVPGSAFAVDTPRPHHLRLSFATAAPGDMDRAVARLAAVLP